ncbi:zinc finger protein 600-like [Orussus abietinus]|uniref:zinc finger protein 600-like n=1 Tax=Orussus abietinus TaxID=222816 RepID=UPI000625A5BB|nr:zinc finger protein 600-like [Orussus abietinus]
MVRTFNFSVTCRLCAKTYREEKLIKIFSTRGTSLNLKASINGHLPIKVTEKDNLPLNICIMCLRRVNATNEFFDIVVTSDRILNKFLKKREDHKTVPLMKTSNVAARNNKKHLKNNADCDTHKSSIEILNNGESEEMITQECYGNGDSEHVENVIKLPDCSSKLQSNFHEETEQRTGSPLFINGQKRKINDYFNRNEQLQESKLLQLMTKEAISAETNDKNEADVATSECSTLKPSNDCNISEHKNSSSILYEHSEIKDELHEKNIECNPQNKGISAVECRSNCPVIESSSCNNLNSILCNTSVGQTFGVQLLTNGSSNRSNYIVPWKTSILSNDSSDSSLQENSNVVLCVANSTACKSASKIPIEVLRCSDCEESVKIFSAEDRVLFFSYLKQHTCSKATGSNRSSESKNETIETFAEYKMRHMMKPQKKECRNERFPLRHSPRSWPGGDLPADPGPDPVSQEDIFEDNVRLDDDFHWPMPKRNRHLHRCNSCEFITMSVLRLKSHQKLHRLERKQGFFHTKCGQCHKSFETSSEVRKHERTAHVLLGAKNCLCEYCGLMKPQKSLREHILKQHTTESMVDMHECKICGKLFISPNSLYLHKKIHAIERPHLCDLCGKAFKQRIAMRRHYMLHFPRAPPKFTCSICEKRVTTRGSLRLHMMRHTGEKPQKCPECHMVMRHGLKHHMRLHSDEAPFKCVVCGGDFKRRDYIRRHMRKHLNDNQHRTFLCATCRYTFDDIKSFLLHHRDVHHTEIFTQIKTYECKICMIQFTNSLQYMEHESVCIDLQKEPSNKLYTNLDQEKTNNFHKTNIIRHVEKSCETVVINDNVSDVHSTQEISGNYNSRSCSDDLCNIINPSNDGCTAYVESCSTLGHAISRNSNLNRSQISCNVPDCTSIAYTSAARDNCSDKIIDPQKPVTRQDLDTQKNPPYYFDSKYEESGEAVQDLRRARKNKDFLLRNNEQINVALTEQVEGLEREYTYMNTRQDMQAKDIILIDETIAEDNVHSYDIHQVQHYENISPGRQMQSQLCLPHPGNVSYTREPLSWKQL